LLFQLIQDKKQIWFASEGCPVRSVVKYIRARGELRDAQIEAIETWLFLKIAGQSKPLWRLFAEGFFNSNEKIDKHGYVIRNGEKSKTFWDATVTLAKKPVRMKIRNIAGDESVFTL